MGKRELVIIIAFIAMGAVAYQMTAPDPKPGERSFSLSRIFSGIRNEMREHSTKASVELGGAVAVESGIRELRISTPRSVPLMVLGEKRADVAYELPVESTGPDEATAKEYARKVTLREDPLGPVLSLTLTFPEEGTQTARLTVRVPNHLQIRVENAGRISVADVASLELRNTAGETNVTGVLGEVHGSHRTGDLTITGARSVDLSLASARLKLKGIKDSTKLNMRSGECWIGESSGPIEATLSNVEFTVVGHTGGETKIGAEGGRIEVTRPASALSIDARRAVVNLEFAGTTGETTVLTTDEPVRVTLADDAALVLDASAAAGEIKVSDLSATPEKDAQRTRLVTTIGAGGARVVVRNARGDIVISRRK